METLGFLGMIATLMIVAYVAYIMSKPHSIS